MSIERAVYRGKYENKTPHEILAYRQDVFDELVQNSISGRFILQEDGIWFEIEGDASAIATVDLYLHNHQFPSEFVEISTTTERDPLFEKLFAYYECESPLCHTY